MKSKVLIAATSAAFLVFCVAEPAEPMTRWQKLDDLYDPPAGESDPWVPDGRDPSLKAMVNPIQTESIDDRDAAATASPTLLERVWLRTMVNMLRVFGLGGIVR